MALRRFSALLAVASLLLGAQPALGSTTNEGAAAAFLAASEGGRAADYRVTSLELV